MPVEVAVEVAVAVARVSVYEKNPRERGARRFRRFSLKMNTNAKRFARKIRELRTHCIPPAPTLSSALVASNSPYASLNASTADASTKLAATETHA